MNADGGKKAAISTISKVTSIFILDFILNFTWSFAALIIYSAVLYNANGAYMNEKDIIDQMIRSPEYLFITSIYNLFVIMLVYFYWKYADRYDTEIIGLKWKKNSLKMFELGLLGGFLEVFIIMLLSLGMGTLWFQGSGFMVFNTAEIQSSLFYGILAFLMVGFGEEAIFRGYIQKRLMLSFGDKWALLTSSLIFMAAHVFTYGKLLDFIDIALGGIILGYLYILTDFL